MRRSRRLALIWALLSCVGVLRAGEPLPSPSAGAGATTLLVSDAAALPFSLFDARAAVRRFLSAADTRVVEVTEHDLTPDLLKDAPYVVFLGVGEGGSMARAAASVLASGKRVLAIGSAANPGRPSFVASSDLRRGEAIFRGAITAFFSADILPPHSETMATCTDATGKRRALAWRCGQGYFFAALPAELGSGFVFSDVLWDFFGIAEIPASKIFLVLDSASPGGDPSAFRALADSISARGWKFAVAADLASRQNDPVKQNDFVAGLRYAQARGGRILLKPEGPFWDRLADRPLPQEQIEAGIKSLAAHWTEFVAAGVFPIALRLPEGGFGTAGIDSASAVSRFAVGALQVSDVTAGISISPGSPFAVAKGLVVWPTAPWFVADKPASVAWDTARNLLKLRGTLLGVSVPAWWTSATAEPVLDALAGLGTPFADPLDGPVKVSAQNAYVLSKNGGEISLDGRFRVRAFDRKMARVGDESSLENQVLSCPPGAELVVAERLAQ